MSESEVETILARLAKIEGSVDKIEGSLNQVRLTVAKLEGTNATSQKMLGWFMALIGVIGVAGLFRLG